MTPPKDNAGLMPCREAYKKWITKDGFYPWDDDYLESESWQGFEAAWNTRANAESVKGEDCLKLFTDYPFLELGDEAGKEAPIRECIVKAYDGDKYCTVIVDGHEDEIKRGYIYSQKGRCGEVRAVTLAELEAILNKRQSLPPTSAPDADMEAVTDVVDHAVMYAESLGLADNEYLDIAPIQAGVWRKLHALLNGKAGRA
jgi:hypothetical protein